jgi:hypothetical protein
MHGTGPASPHAGLATQVLPHLSEKYIGVVILIEFLQIYTNFILIAGGNKTIMANYFPVALTGTTRSWLMNLLPESLFS